MHVWRARLDLPLDALAHLEHIASAEELAAARRKRFAHLRDAAIAAAGLLRLVLARYAHVEPGELAFGRGPHGKPFLCAPRTAPRFNLAHSSAWLLVAVAADREVGIDVEEIVPTRVDDALAERVLSARELEVWRTAAPGDRVHLFFRAWAHKEACVKAAGTGLSSDPRGVEVLVRAVDGETRFATEVPLASATAQRRWILRELDAGRDCAAALAAEPPLAKVRTWNADGEVRRG